MGSKDGNKKKKQKEKLKLLSGKKIRGTYEEGEVERKEGVGIFVGPGHL